MKWGAPIVVVVMLVAAVLACSFSTAKIDSIKMTQDKDGKQAASVYGPGDTFYCVVEVVNAPDDTKVKAVWKTVDVPGAEADTVLDEAELESGSARLTFNLVSVSPWPAGSYKVEIYLNGEKKKTAEFEVQE